MPTSEIVHLFSLRSPPPFILSLCVLCFGVAVTGSFRLGAKRLRIFGHMQEDGMVYIAIVRIRFLCQMMRVLVVIMNSFSFAFLYFMLTTSTS